MASVSSPGEVPPVPGDVVVRETKRGLLLIVATFVLTILALAAAVVVTYVAYDRQADRVAELAAENEQIEADHVAIGAQFAEQSQELEQAVATARRAFERGFVEGKQLAGLPSRLRPLERYALEGFLIPRGIPKGLAGKPLTIRRRPSAYTVRWRGVALFASADEPLSVWTRQAWPGTQRTTKVAGRTVRRMVLPAGIVYTWAQDARTYAVLARPGRDPAARRLIGTLR